MRTTRECTVVENMSKRKSSKSSNTPTEGRCRICADVFSISELTEEHCPPRCCMEFLKSEQGSIMRAYRPEERLRYRQNGITFQKSTCKKCNNITLATLYDPALLELCQKVKALADTKIILPFDQFAIEVQPVAIMKGVLGHLMAASKVPTDTWLDTLARDCVKVPNKPIPDELHIFYWFYPYADYVAVHRDFAMPSVRGRISSPAEVFATMKYFPVAFLVTKVADYAGLANLDKWRQSPLSTRAAVPIDVGLQLSREWPDITDSKNFVMTGLPAQYSIIATPR